MHEFRRQEYLQAIGIETYIPRLTLPCAAESHLCENSDCNDLTMIESPDVLSLQVDLQSQENEPTQTITLNQVLFDVNDKLTNKTEPSRSDNTSRQVQQREIYLASFSLSVWRPRPGFVIISARNVNAMPTELFLNNFLRFYLKQNDLTLSEEVLRWPASENGKMALTKENACAELQTWLSVQNEFNSIDKLWLFGDIYRYFSSTPLVPTENLTLNSCDIQLDQTSSNRIVKAIIFPDLSQFLLDPQLKTILLSLR